MFGIVQRVDQLVVGGVPFQEILDRLVSAAEQGPQQRREEGTRLGEQRAQGTMRVEQDPGGRSKAAFSQSLADRLAGGPHALSAGGKAVARVVAVSSAARYSASSSLCVTATTTDSGVSAPRSARRTIASIRISAASVAGKTPRSTPIGPTAMRRRERCSTASSAAFSARRSCFGSRRRS